MEDWWYWDLPEIAEGTDQQFYAATPYPKIAQKIQRTCKSSDEGAIALPLTSGKRIEHAWRWRTFLNGLSESPHRHGSQGW